MGSNTAAVTPKFGCPSDIQILPLGSNAEWTDTIGNGTNWDQTPRTAGLLGLLLEKLTDMGLAFALLVAKSHAVAVRVCAPLANFVVSTVKLYGLVVAAVTKMITSICNWTAATPELSSVAFTETVIVPLPPVGGVMLTVGGLVSAGGTLAARKATICMTHAP